jgi:hypothetical protein
MAQRQLEFSLSRHGRLKITFPSNGRSPVEGIMNGPRGVISVRTITPPEPLISTAYFRLDLRVSRLRIIAKGQLLRNSTPLLEPTRYRVAVSGDKTPLVALHQIDGAGCSATYFRLDEIDDSLLSGWLETSATTTSEFDVTFHARGAWTVVTAVVARANVRRAA